MNKVPNDVETLPKISTDGVRCTNVTDDGRATAYRERERSLKTITAWATMWHWLHNRLNPFTQIISFLPHDYCFNCPKDGGPGQLICLGSGVSVFLSWGGGV